MKSIEEILRPTRQWDHLIKDGFITEIIFCRVSIRIEGTMASFRRFALHNPRAMVHRTISDRSKIQLTLNTLLQPEHTSAIVTPHYRRAMQDFFQMMKAAP